MAQPKSKIPFERPEIRVERMHVFQKPKTDLSGWSRKIVPVVRKVKMSHANDEKRDIAYWMKKSPAERMAAITFMNAQFYPPMERMDKTKVVRKKMSR
jgi:hypothetical protein